MTSEADDAKTESATGPTSRGGGQWIKLPERGRRVRWTRALTGLFMDHLACTGDIAKAARLIGIDPAQTYYRARTNAAFAAAWRAAIDAGFLTVETMLIGHILSGGRVGTEDGGTFDIEQALRVLAVQERRMAGRAVKDGHRRQTATREESDALILKRLAAMAAKARREAQS